MSVEGSTDLCKPVGVATPSELYPDGDGGIDNTFGRFIEPLLAEITGGVPLTAGPVKGLNELARKAKGLLSRRRRWRGRLSAAGLGEVRGYSTAISGARVCVSEEA